ncbi:TetR/AcrR family transcriptional regulator [Conexibacter sp. SYSU D00693]|uniref:TetR/AcrR family transcriptional regulator n=1 Tax=Conexibacter sp. SYSU D00693 TaxID=2812560 RepID=UPI00196BA74E|nr:TetR/AcrR family transcriptional regulator [Conexibacter sp. SYSU D00693]
MSDGPKRQARGLERRASILQATLRIVGRDGITAVTHRSVADEAGVPFASVGYYFASKEDLLREALEAFVDEEVARLQAVADALQGAGELTASQLVDGFDAVLSGVESRAQFEIYLEAAREPELQQVADRCFRAYEDIARAALLAAGASEEDVETAAPAVVALTDGLAVRHLAAPGTLDRNALRQAFLLILRAVNPAVAA